jgi:TolA-binding protein
MVNNSTNEIKNIIIKKEEKITLPIKTNKLKFNEDEKKYMDAVILIKEKNKKKALEILVALAKEYPNDQRIKIRLREALQM